MNDQRPTPDPTASAVRRVTMRDLARMPEDQLRAVLQEHVNAWADQGMVACSTMEGADLTRNREAAHVDGLLRWQGTGPRMAPKTVRREDVVATIGTALGDVLGTFDWFRGSSGPNRSARRRAARRARAGGS